MQKDYERCCPFSQKMMGKYGAEILEKIAVELKLGLNFLLFDVDGKKV